MDVRCSAYRLLRPTSTQAVTTDPIHKTPDRPRRRTQSDHHHRHDNVGRGPTSQESDDELQAALGEVCRSTQRYTLDTDG
jgi:hypothetical protein